MINKNKLNVAYYISRASNREVADPLSIHRGVLQGVPKVAYRLLFDFFIFQF